VSRRVAERDRIRARRPRCSGSPRSTALARPPVPCVLAEGKEPVRGLVLCQTLGREGFVGTDTWAS